MFVDLTTRNGFNVFGFGAFDHILETTDDKFRFNGFKENAVMIKFKMALAMLVVVACSSNASAELVVDSFSTPGNPASLSVGSGMVDRTNSSQAFFTQDVGFQFVGNQMASVNYVVANGGTFGDLGDFSKGISFSSTSSSFNSNFFVALVGDGTDVIGNGPKAIQQGRLTFDGDLSSYSSLSFSVVGFTPGVATLGGTLTAVPEPTAMVLFGLGVCTVAFRRRRNAA